MGRYRGIRALMAMVSLHICFPLSASFTSIFIFMCVPARVCLYARLHVRARVRVHAWAYGSVVCYEDFLPKWNSIVGKARCPPFLGILMQSNLQLVPFHRPLTDLKFRLLPIRLCIMRSELGFSSAQWLPLRSGNR